MESVDIDMVIDIPDTPDRISAKRRQAAGKEHVSSSSSCSRNFCLFDEDHSNKMGDSEKIRRSRSLLGRTNSTGELENANDLQPSGKAPLLRRTAGEKDKGKAVYTKFPLKLSGDQRSLKVAGKVDKGKGKLNDETEEEKIILSSPSPPKKDDRILSFDRPVLRAPQRRRLVKNGCISPHGIAARAKKPAEDIQTSSKDDVPDQHCTREAAFTNPSPVDIQEIVKEDDASDGAKGKRAITRRFTKDSEIQIINVDETRDGRRESGSGGRRSTHSCETRIDQTFPGRNKLCSRFSAPTTSSLSARTNQKSERNQIDNRAIKRRRGNLSAASDEPGTSLYGTSEESSRSRLSNFQNHQNVAVLHQVLEPDTSPEMCVGGIGGTGSVDNGELEAKARQLEADEMLARELQEQLEQDASILDDCEIDESIAWALQREENSRHASSSQNHRPRRRSSSVSSIRQARTQLQQNSLSRRANTPRANFPVRTAWSRRNSSDRSVAGAPRNLNFRFPTGMAIESRVDMLEVLEAAAEELNGTMNRSSRLLQFDGEFSEEHYEMLLALDEDNHQHGGSSINLVNSLPQSTVKTDSFEEACVICLDTPAKGDVIRHLPCLHKFHKDCIDPWLGRSKSCPVCKSSIS